MPVTTAIEQYLSVQIVIHKDSREMLDFLCTHWRPLAYGRKQIKY